MAKDEDVHPDVARRAADLAGRAGAPKLLPGTAKQLLTSMHAHLTQAYDRGRLADSQHQIMKSVRLKEDKGGHFLCGGLAPGDPKNFRRDPTLPHLTRDDGAWFDFGFILRESKKGVEVLAYDAELRFKSGSWVRFDLNPPEHLNDIRELRSHFHPGNDDLMAPMVALEPLELLDVIVYGLRHNRDKPRI